MTPRQTGLGISIVVNLAILAGLVFLIASSGQAPSTWQEYLLILLFGAGPLLNILLVSKSSPQFFCNQSFFLKRIVFRVLALIPMGAVLYLGKFEWLAITSFVLGVIGPWELWNFFDRRGFEGFGVKIPPAIKAGEIQPPKDTRPKHSAMELKILNTLWTKQVNKFPDFDKYFTFVISVNSPEYFEFRKAGSKLLGEGYVGETQEGHYHITREGFAYCKLHYKDFPSDQWWPEEPINPDNLNKVIK
jgi:hypothetical protein